MICFVSVIANCFVSVIANCFVSVIGNYFPHGPSVRSFALTAPPNRPARPLAVAVLSGRSVKPFYRLLTEAIVF